MLVQLYEISSPKEARAVATVQQLKRRFTGLMMTRSIPVVSEESIAIAQSYDGITDLLLLDSHRAGDTQIGALGVAHSWEIDRKIVESVRIPLIIAGGLGPGNVVDAQTKTMEATRKTCKRSDGSLRALSPSRMNWCRATA